MTATLPIPKVAAWHALYEPDAEARCIKDNPPMYGFGRMLKKGDIVKVDSVCWSGIKYQIGVREECAFYDLEGYFEVVL
jgi:hypothetical protein